MGKILPSLLLLALSVLPTFAAAKFKFVPIPADTPLSAQIDGEFAPICGLKAGEVRNFGGIDFKISDGVMRLNDRRNIAIEFPKNGDSYKYMYILSNRGERMVKENAKNNLAEIIVSNPRSQERY